MDLQNLAVQFIKYLEGKGRSQSTLTAYKKDIEQLITYIAGLKGISKLEDINNDTLQTYIESLKQSQTFTLKTISRKINSLRTFFKFLIAEDKIGINPATSVKHPKSATVMPRVLSSLEYRAIRDAARINLKHFTMIELLLQTGMRIGELSRLRRTDIVLNSDGKDTLNIVAFSTIPARNVELNQLASMAIRDFIAKTTSTGNDQVDFLFYTKSGRPVLIRNIRTALHRIFKKAGINNATVNDLRNTFIVYQLQNGLKIDRLAQIVGHKKVSTTERYLPFLEVTPEKTHNRITPL